jgi:hypothetical protein
MISITYILSAIAISAIITFALRALPFVVKTRLMNSAFMENFAKWMPIGAMVILFIYALSKAPWHAAVSLWLPYVLGLLITVGMHLWRRNFLLSIVLGTATCITLSVLLN